MSAPDDEDDPEHTSQRATLPANGMARRIEIEGLDPRSNDRYVGTTLAGRYRILGKLGQGGMGAVYAAEHVLIEKRVAIKILSNQHSKELLRRFAQEAKAASRIGHENIIDITDFGETDEGVAFLAMEHLEGRDLGNEVRTRGALTV
jgi:eukaryotic-like serine/threonine-protein kinase